MAPIAVRMALGVLNCKTALLPAADIAEYCLIAAVWVNPAASDAEAVYRNNRQATRDSIVAGVRQTPDLRTVLEARAEPWNPYFRPGA